MLPYTSSNYSGYGGSSYGRRKGFLSSQSTILGAAGLLILASLGFAIYSSTRASSVLAEQASISREFESARIEIDSLKTKLSSRNAEYDQLEVANSHSQRRMTELSTQLLRKEADIVSKDNSLHQHISERVLMEQHRNAREADLTKMVEDLRKELLTSDGVVDSLEKKVSAMEVTHNEREQDWHKLATTWIKYEEDLHEHYKKCTEEVAKLRNLTVTAPQTAPLPEAEPKLRPETDFGHIHVDVPSHYAHKFDPLPPVYPPGTQRPAAGAEDLPLPESKIRESIVQMTGGKLGLLPGEAAPQQQHDPPSPVSSHHNDHYHHAAHHGDHEGHPGDDHYQHNYEQYHGHYDHYDPLDQYWMRDAHGDWNADEGAQHDDHGDAHQQHHGYDSHGGHHDAGHHDTGHHDTGHHDTGHHDTGHHDTGHAGQHDGGGQHNDGGHHQQDQQHQQHQQPQHQDPHHDHTHDSYRHDPYSRRYNHHEHVPPHDHWQHQVGPGAGGGGGSGGGGDSHHAHVPPPMHAMDPSRPGGAHAQHAPSLQQHQAEQDHQKYQDQFQHGRFQQASTTISKQQQQHDEHQQQQQPHGDQRGAHGGGHHPSGDLAYKMGW